VKEDKVRRGSAQTRRFVERFAAALVDAGVPRMPALVFVQLLSEDDASLTADELVERLAVSRAAVSGAVRYLTHVGLVRRERPAGTRRDRYVIEDDDWYALVARRERLLEQWIAAARSGVDALGASSPAGRRLANTAEFFEFLQNELAGVLARWQARTSGR